MTGSRLVAASATLAIVCLGHLPSKAAWPDRIGPFVLESADQHHRLQLGLVGQLQLKWESKDKGADEAREHGISPRARRVRLTWRGHFVDRRLGFYLHLSTAPKSVELMDLYLDYRFADDARLRVGQLFL